MSPTKAGRNGDRGGEIAAVIMEPIMIEEPKDHFLENVKELTQKHSALLVFDEIVTGFRLAMGGAQEYFGVIPDLVTLGKGMANGMPISAVAGRKEIMREFTSVFFSFTFGGEALSLAASIETIKEIKEKNITTYFWQQGEKLKDGYNQLVQNHGLTKYTQCIGLPAHTAIYFRVDGQDSLELKSLFQQEVIRKGILTMGIHNICFCHDDVDIERTIEAYDSALRLLKQAIDENNINKYLEGEVIKPVFRRLT